MKVPNDTVLGYGRRMRAERLRGLRMLKGMGEESDKE